MGVLRIMNNTGDTPHFWDSQRAATGDPEAEAAVREAERIFQQQRERGATAFRVEPDAARTTTRLDAFDQTAEQIIMVPRVIGG